MTITVLERKTTLVINEPRGSVEVNPTVQRVVISSIGKQGPSGGGSGTQNVFIQDTQPSATGAYLWIDTSGGNLQFLVEDGL